MEGSLLAERVDPVGCRVLVVGLLLDLVLPLAGSASAQLQTRPQQTCIHRLNRGGAKRAQAQGKEILRCVRASTRGQLGGTVDDCVAEDAGGRVSRAERRALAFEAAHRTAAPGFAARQGASVHAASGGEALALARRLFGGGSLNGVIAPERARAKCQLEVLRCAQKCRDTRLEVFNGCKLNGRSGSVQNLPGPGGPRATQNLLGVGQTFGPRDPITDFGQLHQAGDRDEVQDFEHTLQSAMLGGSGFRSVWAKPALEPPNAGLDPELDAIAS